MPDNKRFLSGAADKTIRLWLLDGTLKNTFSELHEDCVTALVALPDNQHVLSAADDDTIKLFEVDTGTILRTFMHHSLDGDDELSATCLALMPDGRRFVSGSEDETVRIVYHGLAL